MTNYIEYQLPLLFSSDPRTGAENVSADGGSFSVTLETPISIPRQSHNCFITVEEATAWWTIYNIVEGENDQISVTYDDGGGAVTYVLTMEAGLYDLNGLSAEIGRENNAVGFPVDLFILVPDTAAQKTVIQFNYALTRVDMTIARNFSFILGFDPRLVPAGGPTSGVEYEKGDFHANFNTIDYLTITSDLVSRGLATNGKYFGVIAQLLIDVPPGSQILSVPFNPPAIPAPELIGESRKRVTFRLTNNINEQVDTQGEFFTCRLVIHYSMPINEEQIFGS